MSTHIVIPDNQVRPGDDTAYLDWIGRYIVDKFAGRDNVVIINLGDFWDMPSLSSYDKGKGAAEGRRVIDDIRAGNAALLKLNRPLDEYNEKQRKNKEKQWKPRRVMLRGNHEERADRAANNDPEWTGVIGTGLDVEIPMESPGWEVIPFLEVEEIDGVAYSHYFYNPMSGRPYGTAAASRLKQIGRSFTMGHQQTLDYAIRFVGEKSHHALIAGACLTPDHKVLTADLRYVELGSVKPGDKLVSFDENVADSEGRSRRYRTGEVLAVRHEPAQVFKVTLDNGKEFKTTADHRWLSRIGTQYVWRTTDSLRKGSRVVKCLDEWETDNSYEAGYLSGMYDGEGCYYTRATQGGKHTTAQLTVSQKPGPVLEKTVSYLKNLVGVDGTTHTNSRGISSVRIKGGTRGVAKVLGMLRPVRLLSKFRPEHIGSMVTRQDDNPSVVGVEP